MTSLLLLYYNAIFSDESDKITPGMVDMKGDRPGGGGEAVLVILD